MVRLLYISTPSTGRERKFGSPVGGIDRSMRINFIHEAYGHLQLPLISTWDYDDPWIRKKHVQILQTPRWNQISSSTNQIGVVGVIPCKPLAKAFRQRYCFSRLTVNPSL